MKRLLSHIERNYSTINNSWNHLKKSTYVPNKEKSVTLKDNDNDLEFKYTKQDNKIIKQLLHRHIDDKPIELIHPKSKMDIKAFNYFIDQIEKEPINIKIKSFITTNKNHSLFKTLSRNFSTLNYKEKTTEKKLSIEPEIKINTSIGDKIITGLSIHKGKVQPNAFKDTDELLLSRLQKIEFEGVLTPYLRIGDKALFSDQDFFMQYDLYCIDKELHQNIILNASRIDKNVLNEHVEATSHFTGMLKTDSEGKAIFEFSEDGTQRPKTEYNYEKGRFVSMESDSGNTASLEYIAYKTQKSPEQKNPEFELIFIPKNHTSIKNIINICDAILHIKKTSTEDPEILDLVLKKHGLSDKEIVVELFNEINKYDESNGIFRINIENFIKSNPKLNEFILNALEEGFIDKKHSYKLEVSEKKDIYNEPIINISDQQYEEPCEFETKTLGNNDDNPDFS